MVPLRVRVHASGATRTIDRLESNKDPVDLSIAWADMYFWQDVLNQQAQQRQFRRAQAAAAAQAAARAESMNRSAAQQSAIPWEQHQKQFDQWAEQEEANRKAEAERQERERQQREQQNYSDFFRGASRRSYRGPLEHAYRVLDIASPSPTKNEVRSAYVAAMRRHHPDAGGSVEEAKAVTVAYQIILDHLNQ